MSQPDSKPQPTSWTRTLIQGVLLTAFGAGVVWYLFQHGDELRQLGRISLAVIAAIIAAIAYFTQ